MVSDNKKGNPNHDEEGKFTSSANASGGYEDKVKNTLGVSETEEQPKDSEYDSKIQTTMGIKKPVQEDIPGWKKAGYDEPVTDVIGSIHVDSEENNEFYDAHYEVTEEMLDSFLGQLGVSLSEEDKELFRDNIVIPTRVIKELGYKNEKDFLDDLTEYVVDKGLIDENDLEVI